MRGTEKLRLSSLAWRNLATRTSRTALTTIGVALGVAVILATSIANTSTVDAFHVMIDSITGKADFLVNSVAADGFAADRLGLVSETGGVADAVPGISKRTNLIIGDEEEDVQFAGIDPLVDRRLRTYSVTDGRFLRPGEAGVLIPEKLADDYGIKLGDTVSVAERGERHRFQVVGLLGAEGAGRFMGGRVVFLPLAQAQSVFGLKDRLNFIDVRVEEGRQTQAVASRVSQRLGVGFTVEMPEKRAEAISQMLRGLQVGLSFFGAIAIFVGGFLVYNTFAMVVLEQTQELGVIRSLGGSRTQISAVILFQALFVGLIGSAIGLASGIALARLLLRFVSDTVDLPIQDLTVPFVGLAVAIAVGLVVTLVAAFQPALMAGRISPLAALRIRARTPSRSLGFLRVAAALAALSLGVYISFLPGGPGLGRLAPVAVPLHAGGSFLLLFGAALITPTLVRPLGRAISWPLGLIIGQPAKLAADNLARHPGRTAGTAAAIMITLAMLISIGGMTTSFRLSVESWVDESLGADVYVSGPSTDALYDADLAGKMKTVKGVDDLTSVGYTVVQAGESRVLFRAIEPQSYRRFASLQLVQGSESAAWRDLRRERRVFISTVTANSRQIGVGDKISVATKKGEREFTVAGVVVDFGGDMGELIIGTRADLREYFDIRGISAFRLKVEDSVRPATVARRIENRFTDMNFQVHDVQEFKDMADEQVSRSFAVFNVLILLAAIVALISVFNTLMMNILERRREIGVLRAVGATRGQVGLITLIEAFITGVIGGILGLLVGGYLAADIVKNMSSLTGYEIDFVFPVETAGVALLIGVVFTVVAAAYPARKAASTNISTALQYD